jgi:hypothetical protein
MDVVNISWWNTLWICALTVGYILVGIGSLIVALTS